MWKERIVFLAHMAEMVVQEVEGHGIDVEQEYDAEEVGEQAVEVEVGEHGKIGLDMVDAGLAVALAEERIEDLKHCLVSSIPSCLGQQPLHVVD